MSDGVQITVVLKVDRNRNMASENFHRENFIASGLPHAFQFPNGEWRTLRPAIDGTSTGTSDNFILGASRQPPPERQRTSDLSSVCPLSDRTPI
ncbi:hypothetical protein Desti_5146 [Desulfomonile tiedjei DSM 6799]|uniref:Uncharacterized protein n=1 Tax=Desulfomonile tiedjei (strain ATCC 49306 / DSM 6799 / DCB-1) TaxID=706587 RepID=I4CDV8_DESTA|nr:hypothetical protein Desti_5146 [Desulfomonile tiedjei DSM 6799]